METVPFDTGEPPEKPSLDPVISDPGSNVVPPAAAAEYVSLDELLDATAIPALQPAEPALVFQPPCRSSARGWWDMANRVTSGEWKHTWQAVILLVVLGAVLCGVLLAGSVVLRAAALSALGLSAWVWLSKRHAAQAQHA
ncbi:hypothetical protein [Amycolatopsis sp. lyj-108]|uniref:hypothetical protein n=1 Tax=Amycolatopsis sp. lyj-108 TaxID=2789286 RepID=UPI00397C9359